MAMLKNRIRQEEGWLVVTAIAVTTMMVGIGLAIFSTVGTQQSQSRQERNRDSAFNLAESALYAQAFILSKNWPTADTVQNFTNQIWSCDDTYTSGNLCPTVSAVRGALDASNIADFKSNIRWSISVRDNGPVGATPSTDYVTDPSSPNYWGRMPSWDANGDQRIWVRADGFAQGKERSLVALLQLENFKEPFPKNVITAGHFQTDDKGNKDLINTKDGLGSGTGSQVVVHCVQTDPSCANYDAGKGQVGPGLVVYSPPPGGDPTQIPTAMPPSELARFQAKAMLNGTYFHNTCPSTLTGSAVFIDFDSLTLAQCPAYVGNATWNSQASPGLLVVRNAVLSLGGTTTFYGLIYAPNPSNSSAYLVQTQGNTHVFGGVAVDGNGGLDVGSSHENVTFFSDVFDHLNTTGAAGLVQNTWRELPAGTQ
jgi:hypothetical protein